MFSRTWAALDQGYRCGGTTARDNRGDDRGEDSLSAWVKPNSRDKPARSSRTRVKPSVDGTEKGDGDSGKWMTERLEGLDPRGAAR